MLAVIVAGNRMVRDDHIRAKFAYFQNHSPQTFFMSPKPECFIRSLRITEILQAEKVRLGALNLGRRHCLARANRSQFFVKLRPNCVLSAFTKGREQTDSVRAVLAAHDDQRRAVLVIRMRGDAHHRPWISQIEQRLIERNAIHRRCERCGLLRPR